MLEYAVRPYQTPNSQGKIIIPSTPGTSTARATLTWGAKATMPPVNSGINVVCCNEETKEVSRKGEIKRIYQFNDETSENYVDVFRANELKLNKKEKNTCASDWDQFSGVGAEIGGALADFGSQFSFDTADGGASNCGVVWKLDNNTAAAANAGA